MTAIQFENPHLHEITFESVSNISIKTGESFDETVFDFSFNGIHYTKATVRGRQDIYAGQNVLIYLKTPEKLNSIIVFIDIRTQKRSDLLAYSLLLLNPFLWVYLYFYYLDKKTFNVVIENLKNIDQITQNNAVLSAVITTAAMILMTVFTAVYASKNIYILRTLKKAYKDHYEKNRP